MLFLWPTEVLIISLWLYFFFLAFSSFDETGKYKRIDNGPIKNDTIVTLDAGTGSLVDHWGSNLFYMPHGLEVDSDGNTWVTDVALHQVMKVFALIS